MHENVVDTLPLIHLMDTHLDGDKLHSAAQLPRKSPSTRSAKAGGLSPIAVPCRRMPTGALGDRTNRMNSRLLQLPSPTSTLTPDATHSSGSSTRSISRSSYTSHATDPDNLKATYSKQGPASSSPSHPLSPHLRRQLRYLRAQEALTATLQSCEFEPSPTELQIHALERATAALSAQAQEARERAAQLRACLADARKAAASESAQQLEPGELRALQRERWMAERRSAAREEQSKATKQLLSRLLSGEGSEHDITRRKISHNDDARRMVAADVNVVRYCERSQTRVPVLFPSPRSHRATHTPPRRKVINRMRSLRLRPTIICTPQPARQENGSRQSASIFTMVNGPSSDSPSNLTSALEPERSSSTQHAGTRRVHFTPEPSAPSSPSPSSGIEAGTASIYMSSLSHPRTADELLHDMDLADAAENPGVPEYALELLDALVARELDVSLAPLPAATRRSITQSRSEAGMSGEGSNVRETMTPTREETRALRVDVSTGAARHPPSIASVLAISPSHPSPSIASSRSTKERKRFSAMPFAGERARTTREDGSTHSGSPSVVSRVRKRFSSFSLLGRR